MFYAICLWLFSEANTEVNDNKPAEDGMLNHQSGDNAENATVVMLPDNNAAVKFVPDGDASTVDVTSSQNGPADGIPSTSADAVVKTKKTDKDEKAKKEKLEVVGMFDLVNVFVIFYKICMMQINDNVNACIGVNVINIDAYINVAINQLNMCINTL